MHGVSEVIAIILILMITIAIAGLAYTFMSSTMASTTSAASSAVDTTTSSMMTSFTIESMDVAKVYIRNTGQNALSSLSVYVNDEPAITNITPSTIAAGQVGTVTIYSFIPDGATVKITSPNGFSTSKVANPCKQAVGCWRFDEGTGLVSYDSSPFGNTGTLANGPVWTSGRYGSSLQFDGTNDYVNAGNSNSLNISNYITVSAWIKINGISSGQILRKESSYFIRLNGDGIGRFTVWNDTSYYDLYTTSALSTNTWYYLVGTYDGSRLKIYVNGVLNNTVSHAGSIRKTTNMLFIGSYAGTGEFFNGIIDEVRLYDRAIY